jgi:hypothetical protein
VRHEVAPVKWPQGSGECPMPVLNSRMRPGGTSRQRGVKQGVKPKKSLNHPGESGERKNGRVNNHEPSMRLRHSKSPKRVVVTAISGSRAQATTLAPRAEGPPRLQSRTPRPRSREGTHPVRVLIGAERVNPVGVRRKPVGRPQGGRKSSAGRRCPRKRRPAAERQREVITGWIGRCSRRKAADLGQGS